MAGAGPPRCCARRATRHPRPPRSKLRALALALAALRGLPVPGLAEMREAALAALCHGDDVALRLIETEALYRRTSGRNRAAVPQMPLARDLAALAKEDAAQARRSATRNFASTFAANAGLLKSTLLHRLLILHVPWGQLSMRMPAAAHFARFGCCAGFRSFPLRWLRRWFSAAPSSRPPRIHCLIAPRRRPRSAILSGMIRAALVADLDQAAAACIQRLQEAAVQASDITELMSAVSPLVGVLRYGTARKLPEEHLRALIVALSIEVNAGVRSARTIWTRTQRPRVSTPCAPTTKRCICLATRPCSKPHGDTRLADDGRGRSGRGAGRRLEPAPAARLASVGRDRRCRRFLAPHSGPESATAGAFLESFLSGGAEVLLQDQPLLHLVDAWLCELERG